jgi:glycosyltransferase involved in cell wall biosynthesis
MKFSIIVCTLNRAHAIAASLDSIAQAIYEAPEIEAELVIVDNGSTDGAPQFIADWAKNRDFHVNIVAEPRKGLSKARNAGMRAATGDVFVFTDDDCVIDRDYISIAVSHHTNDASPVLRGGRVELGDQADLPLTMKTDMTITRRHMNNEPEAIKDDSLGNLILGCNMVMPRSIYVKVGDFDERLGAGTKLPGGEETDYIFRAYLAGVPVEYTPDLIVRHFHGRRRKEEGYKLFGNYFIGNGALYTKYLFNHPAFCRQFYWDFKNALREIRHGRNDFMPVIGFSYKDMIKFNIKGALIYSASCVSGSRAFNERG